MTALDIVRAAPAGLCRPWPRHVLPRAVWDALVAALAQHDTTLLGLWADTAQVHALLRHGAAVVVASTDVEAGRFPALSPVRAVAARFERMIQDLWGHVADGGIDERRWLDHGRWPLAYPLSPRPGLPRGAADPPEFPAIEEAGVLQVPLGPIRGLVDEPAHLRLAARGDTVLRAEARLGYAHKGTLALMRGKSPRAAARFVARLAAEATVAHSLAFARAAEAALDTTAPPRAAALRAVMLEQERIAGHLDALGRLAEAAGLATLHGDAGWLREQWLRAAGEAFGHRLMMDMVVPGGLAADIEPEGAEALGEATAMLAAAVPALRRRAEPLLARLEGIGTIRETELGGVVGRAAGGSFDARSLDLADARLPHVPSAEQTGDAAARGRLCLAEIAGSLALIGTALGALPEGPASVALPAESGEGLGCAESLRGAVWHWLVLDHGQIAATFPCDPGWLLWPRAEAAMAGSPVEEAAMIRLSCGLPVSGLDL